ncbi:MAG TPA: acyl carrier protein, partial [Kofleriaceae bacterium]|nr:acyl carrier protein [Kofleriaceae bacterium]
AERLVVELKEKLAVLARAAGRVPSLMRALDAGAAAPAAGPSEFLARFTATPASLQREVMTLQLRTRVAAALGVAPPAVDVARPLMEMGIDSLVAIELRNQLSADVGRPLPATLLFNYTTVDALAAHLVELLAPAPAAEPAPPPPLTAAITAAPSALEALLSEVEALSQDPS